MVVLVVVKYIVVVRTILTVWAGWMLVETTTTVDGGETTVLGGWTRTCTDVTGGSGIFCVMVMLTAGLVTGGGTRVLMTVGGMSVFRTVDAGRGTITGGFVLTIVAGGMVNVVVGPRAVNVTGGSST